MRIKPFITGKLRIKRSPQQRGLSLISLVVIMAVLGSVGLIVMRSVPGWSEYSSIKKAAQRLESEGITDPAEVRRKWDERAPLEYITTLSGQALRIQRVSGGVKIDFDYEKRIPLIGNATLVYEFSSTPD